MAERLQLLVGLGNPGPQYVQTRHNAGFWFVEAVARQHRAAFKQEKRFHGHYAKVDMDGQPLHLLMPDTFMNRSGQAIQALCQFFKIPAEAVLVAHDELDLPAGVARLKQGGGHGGHNGLRDTIEKLGGNRQFYRLRIGIDHPGSREQVTPYVLGKPPAADADRIHAAIDEALACLPEVVSGEWQKAMNRLHGFSA